ncbi:MAG: transporter [Bacteroidales bacterium]|nr:transporter [Bacteroidales bacterium]
MSGYRYTFKKFLKDWMLVIGMIAGAGIYLVYHAIPALHPAGPYLEFICRKIQPVLLFSMLFLAFCKIEPSQLKPHRWQGWLLIIQGSLFITLAVILALCRNIGHFIGLESLMLCLICPTATACAVVTGKLGGDMAGVVGYTILINILVSILVPTFIPLIHPMEGMTFAAAFSRIIAKVFPLLIMPCLLAWVVRYLFPIVHARILKYTDAAFYIWAVALTLAILTSTRAIVQSDEGPAVLLDMAIASALACIFQFWAGKRVGQRYGHTITAGQALGQKNTVFGIWMGYTFLDPVTSISCGFFSIWQNAFNTWQLYKTRKKREKSGAA